MRVLLVLLGASEFPRVPALSSPAFAASRTAVKAWMLDPAHGPAVQPADCLDLFDSAKSWNDQEGDLLDWLAERLAAAPAPTDLVIHYVGHGGFRDATRDYYLAIRATRPENRYYSSLMVDSLWRAVRGGARPLRRFLIIDACFAAAAARALMSPLDEVVKVKVKALQEEDGAGAVAEAVPDRGTAVLCSSSADDGSSLAGAGGVTQFTDGLLAALATGSAAGGARLTLDEVSGLVRAELRARYDTEAVLPEVHAPDQRLGLPQRVPLFPNLAHKPAAPRVPAAPRGRDDSDIPLQMALGNPTKAGTGRDNFLIRRPQYALSWSALDGRPNWVSWHLSERDLGNVARGDGFRADPECPTVQRLVMGDRPPADLGEFRLDQPPREAINWRRGAPVAPADYRGSGFDRGHLCPPGDRRGSAADQAAVFLMSNVVPQAKVRNQRLWQGLEEHCRGLARQGWEVFVIAGPGGNRSPSILEPNSASTRGGAQGRLAGGRICVPDFLWKIALSLPPGATLAEAPDKARVDAIRMANSEHARIQEWWHARVKVLNLEDELGYTFFDALGPAAADLKWKTAMD